MSDLEARQLERVLKRDGGLHQFVLMTLEDMDREALGLVLERTTALMKERNPATEALKRGLRDGDRLQHGEITPDELVEELEASPLRQWDGNTRGMGLSGVDSESEFA